MGGFALLNLVFEKICANNSVSCLKNIVTRWLRESTLEWLKAKAIELTQFIFPLLSPLPIPVPVKGKARCKSGSLRGSPLSPSSVRRTRFSKSFDRRHYF